MIPKMGNILEENGQLLVQQFSEPLNDLLSSLIGQQPIGNIFGNFEKEIEIGSKKANPRRIKLIIGSLFYRNFIRNWLFRH